MTQKKQRVYHDWIEDGVRFLVLQGPASVNAYFGVPESHPLAGFDYGALPLSVHGGLTFSGKGGGAFPKGWFWYGYDFAHVDDDNHTVASVLADLRGSVYDILKVVRFAEKVKNRA